MNKLIWLEINEVNIDFIQNYISLGYLPNFNRLIERYGYIKTVSEQKYENLEPWIQWVSAHTGKTFSEHNIFRLGDAADEQFDQIWEKLEAEHGLTVAAMSPMNAGNKTSKSAFFVPDPWTKAKFNGSWHLKLLYESVVGIVNNNACGTISSGDALKLLCGLLINFRITNIKQYAHYILSLGSGRWYKALILDRLLADTFIKQWKLGRPHFSTLFLNAGAHIQHHYMFSSPCYKGDLKNPDGYITPGKDPLLDVYRLYDDIIEEFFDLDNVRLMLLTGLSQKPNNKMVFYYRLKNHESFLKLLNVPVDSVEPRMSRDFLVRCKSNRDAKTLESTLMSITSEEGINLFMVDNRGKTLFCMLAYTKEINEHFKAFLNGIVIDDFFNMVDFVTIENGIHKTDGVFIDTGIKKNDISETIPLTDIYNRTLSHFNS